MTNHNFWPQICFNTFRMTKNPDLQLIQNKIIHRTHYTGQKMFRMGLAHSNICTHCTDNAPDDYTRLYTHNWARFMWDPCHVYCMWMHTHTHIHLPSHMLCSYCVVLCFQDIRICGCLVCACCWFCCCLCFFLLLFCFFLCLSAYRCSWWFSAWIPHRGRGMSSVWFLQV